MKNIDVFDAFNDPTKRVTVLSFMNELIESLENNRRLGTAHNYKCAVKSFADFLNQRDITFSLMTSKLVSDYEQ